MWGSSNRANVAYFGITSRMLDTVLNPESKRKQEAACQCESVLYVREDNWRRGARGPD